jgi:hypothetical protein
MTTINISDQVGGDFPIGGVIRFGGVEHKDSYVVYEVNAEASTLTFARETWIARVIRWNPCNDLRLALGVWS